MSSWSTSVNPQTPGLETCFKRPDGRYKLLCEKTRPAAVLHYFHGKAVSQLTIAYLNEKPMNQSLAASSTLRSSGERSAAARLLGAGNGSRALSFVCGNGLNQAPSGGSKIGVYGTSIGLDQVAHSRWLIMMRAHILYSTRLILFLSEISIHRIRIASKPYILATRIQFAVPLIRRLRMTMI